MRRVGAAMGADTGTPFNPHGHAAWELSHMVRAGMKPADALKAGTATAADLLRLDDRGRLRDGQAADIIVTVGDPASDITAIADKANHRLILKDGRPVLDRFAGSDRGGRSAAAVGRASRATPAKWKTVLRPELRGNKEIEHVLRTGLRWTCSEARLEVWSIA